MKKVNRMAALIMIMIGLLLVGCDPAPVKIPPSLTPQPTFTPMPTMPSPEDYQKTLRRMVDTICLDVSQVEQRGDAFSTYHAILFAAKALVANGFVVVEPGEDCDATLVIQASFTGIKANYQVMGSIGSKACYGAASSEGSWVLTILDSDLPPLVYDMDVEFDPSTISNCATEEDHAPLITVWIKAVATNLKRLGFSASVPGWTIPPLD